MSEFDPTTDPKSPMPSYITGTLRTLGAFVAGIIVSKGWFTAQQVGELGGGAMVLAAWLWSMWNAHHKTKAINSAIAAPAGQEK